MTAAIAQRDICVTWPKSRPLDSYLAELARAEREGLEINYRVGRLPAWPGAMWDHGTLGFVYGQQGVPRCYMVHSGFVRGWCSILYGCHREAGEVAGWPAGLYIVRSPVWHALADPIPMRGFQGWRWMT